jgi:regulator of sigma E protease
MLLTIITFFIVLSILILVHELGHFVLAKKAGIKVEEFGFGYPPRIFGKKIGETVYSLNWLFFGGFVRLYGEEYTERRGREHEKTRKRAFWAKSKKARTAVIVSGVLANFVLAIVVFSIVYSFSGIPTKTGKIRVAGLIPDTPAQKSGLKEGDVILQVNEERLNNLNHFIKVIDQKKGVEISLTIDRDKDNPCQEKVFGGGPTVGEQKPPFSCQDGKLILWTTPRANPPQGEGPLGVLVSDVEIRKYPFWQMPWRGTVEGFKEAFGWAALILGALKGMFLDLVFHGTVPQDVAGPVGIFQLTGMVAKSGILNILQFMGILSVNLAVINILPFPALDGGRLVFIIYEAVTRKKPKPSFEQWVNTLGMAFLLLLIILITVNDVGRLVKTTSLLSKIRSLWPF